MISVVLATHNEEKNIRQCLDSVKDIADEIIVVDGESTDKTVDIAKQLGAMVLSTTNKSNFHINKQMAMDEAKGELVLQMDADEAADPVLITFIKKVHENVKKGDRSVVAWYIKRKNFFLSKFLTKGGQYPDPVIRLYVNGKARLPQKNVHEQMSVDGTISTAVGHLLHYPYPTFDSYMKKFDLYTSFEAERQLGEGFVITGKNTLSYMFFKPVLNFFSLYFRHKGFVDGMPGFIFALMSSLHAPFVYLKIKEKSG